MSHSANRLRWMRGPGTTRSIDLGHRVMDDFHSRLRLRQITDDESARLMHRFEQQRLVGWAARPNSIGFYLVGAVLRVDLQDVIDSDVGSSNNLLRRYGVEDNGEFTFGGGLADQAFTWHFAPFIAHEIVKATEEESYIAPGVMESMALGDWATILVSDWFSNLMHDLSLAPNGTYGSKGFKADDYLIGGRLDLSKYSPELNTDKELQLSALQIENGDGTGDVQIIATMEPELRKLLRHSMKQSKSTGCPVARKNITTDLETPDQHRDALLERGLMRKVALGKGGIRLVQDRTPIDRSLQLFAGYLREYEAKWGTPLAYSDGIRHESRSLAHPLIIPYGDEGTQDV